MSGTAIIAELLLVDSWFRDLAAAGRLKEDRLPENAPLPAVLLATVSSIDRLTLEAGEFTRSADRVAVTVRAASARGRKEAIDRIRAACKDKRGDLAGCFRVSVTTAGRGPSMTGPADSFEQTQDFRVSFDAAV